MPRTPIRSKTRIRATLIATRLAIQILSNIKAIPFHITLKKGGI